MSSKSNTKEFGYDFLPIWCEGCNEQGYIFDKDVITEPFFVVCAHCQFETSSVWCPQCEMGGEFVENIKDRPNSWTCPTCKTQHTLPPGFYDSPKTLYLESSLPEDVQVRVAPQGDGKPMWFKVAGIFVLFVGIPFLIGGLTGILIDPQMMVFTGIAGFFGSLVGFVILPKGRWMDRAGLLAISLIPFACQLLSPIRASQIQAQAISYALGAVYGIVLLLWVRRLNMWGSTTSRPG
jgi:hypothetical protein